MSEVSTRVWLDEALWNAVRGRAVAEALTVREVIPRLLDRAVRESVPSPGAVAPVASAPSAPAAASRAPTLEGGLPVVVMSEMYVCGVCGAQIRLGAVSQHIGKHMREQQAAATEGG